MKSWESLRQLVNDVLSTDKHPQATELARRAVHVYDQRSTLIHEGALPIGKLEKAEKEAKEIVELVLKAMFHLANDSA